MFILFECEFQTLKNSGNACVQFVTNFLKSVHLYTLNYIAEVFNYNLSLSLTKRYKVWSSCADQEASREYMDR